ncbi:hypothetical protein AcW1_006268 [Taiwanofungus camphoratus]|nr:hypothetical protein AcW2_005024 [Antrodia cinnamomea]KAI0958091.1 hypothetical protein AcW1_006268 [Antrodia cinnamomea]
MCSPIDAFQRSLQCMSSVDHDVYYCSPYDNATSISRLPRCSARPQVSVRACSEKNHPRATKLAPFDSLPFALMPRRKQSMKPPIMHFGWLVEADDLLRYAEEHQIRVHRQEVSFSDEEDDDDEEEEEANKPQLDPRRTMEAALGFMAGRLGLQFPDRSLSIEIPLRIGGFRIVSLYTNYYFKEIPSEDVIEVFGKELAKELKTDEVPKWYLDGINWHWV